MEQIGLLHDGQIYDLQTAEALNIKGDIIKADDSKESLEILRHSLRSHDGSSYQRTLS